MVHHLAMRMRDFHALGYVHRDLKPGNVMWLITVCSRTSYDPNECASLKVFAEHVDEC